MNAQSMLHPAMSQIVDQFRTIAPGTLTSTFRSIEEQAQLRRNFELGRARFPAELPGNSTHHTGLSFDYVVRQGTSSPEQTALGRAWNAAGGIWSERDRVHFQHPEAIAVLRAGLTRQRWWI